ncbi:MAG TPA: carbamoyltransferase HypF [Flavisolibacter sp.]|nr:carbamoyltransferase HypF [Flavisolibacter sp.]
MKSYHIHISGQVQGVGFRPYVYKLAEKMDIKGWISNSNDGVHIHISADEATAIQFYQTILESPPLHSIITHHHLREIPVHECSSFTIKESITNNKPNLLFTPDIAICDECKREVLTRDNRWYSYPFTTCLHCGPRYSIITGLPYDRINTTMAPLPLCKDCERAYNDVYNRRHYSQTISCAQCAIPMHLYDNTGNEISDDDQEILLRLINLLKAGNIIAVKGVGGYLLICDATNDLAIAVLRKRKHRPAKPFALLYSDIETIRLDAELTEKEIEALGGTVAPIVLCRLKEEPETKVCSELIAPGLNRIGAMLPYTPLLLIIANEFEKPLIATSGNVSGSPIIYNDAEALSMLNDVADYILTYEREIVIPQDDSVMQFAHDQKIILRRSRGLAPNYYPTPFKTNQTILAMGGELKSAFAITNEENLYISQFLGDQASAESQGAYTHTVDHLLETLQAKPEIILIDSHPGYFVSTLGREKASHENIPIHSIQHHEAHFGAVLAENSLLQTHEPVLGVIWDGTGYGHDEQIWGGEFFIYEEHEMHRVAHLDYFSQLFGDKMSKEPRLSALSLLKNFPQKQKLIEKQFLDKEWEFYQRQIQQPGQLLTSSTGRLLDGLASILGICQLNSYEGEAAMKLEAIAANYRNHSFEYYPIPLTNNRLQHNVMLPYIFEDLEKREDISFIAWKIFCSLAKAIENVSNYFGVDKIAFSGGVFQNELLVGLVIKLLADKKELYFHKQLSPNDECIGFGQIACYEILKTKQSTYNQLSTSYVS